MTPLKLYVQHTMDMETALRGHLCGALDRSAFLDAYRQAFRAYKASVDSPVCARFAEIADCSLFPGDQLREVCRAALDELPLELLDRSTRAWIDHRLIREDGFGFVDQSGAPLFGHMRRLYSTPLKRHSFLLSAIDGAIQPASFRYDDLLRALGERSANHPATWALCTEPFGAMAHIDYLHSHTDAFTRSDRLTQLEQLQWHDIQEHCYLLLIPADREWLLVNRYDFQDFAIELHGSSELLDFVCGRLACATVHHAD